MNETAREWITKAEGDFNTARRELLATDAPNFDAACFHAQQCIEKLMKAVLIHHGIVPPRTHDLGHLDSLLGTVDPSWTCPAKDLRFLTRAAVEFRYPGEAATREDAEQALVICGRLREQLLALLGGGHEA